jgi:hypothetical protein
MTFSSSMSRAEYTSIIKTYDGEMNDTQLASLLMSQAEWTEEGAQALILLVRNYGAFMLRNALALAEALNIEDGALGY